METNKLMKKHPDSNGDAISDLFASLNITPQFPINNIPIVYSSSHLYTRYVSVSIISLLENSNPSYNYDINILHSGLSDEVKNRMKCIESLYSNVLIRFIDVKDILEPLFQHFYLRGQVSKESYFRFFVGEIFRDYRKLVYLDADTVINTDIVELFHLNIDNKLIAATNDVSIFLWAIKKIKRPDLPFTYDKYFSEILKILPNQYFQAGVMLINSGLWFQEHFAHRCMEKLKQIGKPLFVDQDIINIIANGRVTYLDIQWNYGMHIKNPTEFSQLPARIYNCIVSQRKNIKILHMTGDKCDRYPHSEFSQFFWTYARKSPFYEIFLFDNILTMPSKWNRELANIHFPNINKHFAAIEEMERLLFVGQHGLYFRFKKLRYGFMSAFTFGSRHQKYKRKYELVKIALHKARELRKSFFRI